MKSDDFDAAPGEVRLKPQAIFQVPVDVGQKGHDHNIARLHSGHQFLPSNLLHCAAAGYVDEESVLEDAVLNCQVALGFEVPDVVVGLADPGSAAAD